MRLLWLAVILMALSFLGCAASRQRQSEEALIKQVTDTERAFAQTMATRDYAAFVSFISEEAVFLSGDKPLKGRQQVAALWKQYYEGAEPPFSWEPGQVVVLESGTLALSTGPVRNAKGELIATFTSIWRLEEPGKWRIIFDKGDKVCGEKR